MERKILTASDGKMLTNGSVFATTIVLGDWDKAENYREVSFEEYEKEMAKEKTETHE